MRLRRRNSLNAEDAENGNGAHGANDAGGTTSSLALLAFLAARAVDALAAETLVVVTASPRASRPGRPWYDPRAEVARTGERVLARLKAVAAKLRTEARVWRLVLRHPRTPRSSKALLWLALGYLALPFDLIPDFIPVIGHLDDALIVPLLVYVALRLVPKGVVDECRKAAERGPEAS